MKIRLVLAIFLNLFMGCFWIDSSFASGFSIPVKSISDQGNQFAGGAALASDASTNYYNPAGNTRINHPELVTGLVYIFSPARFEGEASAPSPTLPPPLPAGLIPAYQGTGKANTFQHGLLPLLHFVSPMFSDKLFFGFSVTVPSGLSTKYEGDSILRYANLQASASFINLSPSLAFKITDKLSIGAGPDFQKFDATFKNLAYAITPIMLPPFIKQVDAETQIDASSWGYGWHAGLMYQFTPHTRMGLSYISKIIHDASGTSSFSLPEHQQLNTTNLKLRLVLPPSTLLSIYHEFADQWAIMGTIGYTQWNVFKDVIIKNVASPSSTFTLMPKDITMPENFHNTWSFATGLNYKFNEKFLLRLGISVETQATDDVCRDVIMPDSAMLATTIGFHFQQTKAIGWDVGYGHSFNRVTNINHISNLDAGGTTETGTYRRQGNALGVQLVLNFEELFKRKKSI